MVFDFIFYCMTMHTLYSPNVRQQYVLDSSLPFYACGRKSEESMHEAHGGGGGGFASKASNKNREDVDVLGKTGTY